jgi:hypothetical protein
MNFRQRSALTLVGVSAVVALVGTGLATPERAVAANPTPTVATDTVSHVNKLTPQVKRLARGTGVAAQTKAISAYWTSARMKSAKSLDGVSAGTAARQSAKTVNKPQGRTGSVKPAKSVVTPKAKRPSVSAKYVNPNFPYYSFGARTNGKVFFTRSNVNYVCSGTVVNSEGKSTVWTAGHCVTGNKVWDSNFTFVPSYSNGSAPYGYWYAKNFTTTSAFYNNNNDFANDVAGVVMYRNSYGYRIVDYLGGQGITWNQSANYYTCAFGFPQASPFNGAYLYEACGSTYNAGNGTIYMYSGLTGGSSGGAWYYGYNSSTQSGYINGHNDFIYTSSPSWMYSPYYGNQVAGVYNAVRNVSS